MHAGMSPPVYSIYRIALSSPQILPYTPFIVNSSVFHRGPHLFSVPNNLALFQMSCKWSHIV